MGFSPPSGWVHPYVVRVDVAAGHARIVSAAARRERPWNGQRPRSGRSSIETVEALGRDYWLYVVYDCGTEPKRHIVRDPARANDRALNRVQELRVLLVEEMSI